MIETGVLSNVHDISEAVITAQNFVLSISTRPGDGIGISAALLTNFLAAGLACGAFQDDFVELIITAIRESVDETFKAIIEGIAAEAGFHTIQ
jgi:hypothetical protein